MFKKNSYNFILFLSLYFLSSPKLYLELLHIRKIKNKQEQEKAINNLIIVLQKYFIPNSEKSKLIIHDILIILIIFYHEPDIMDSDYLLLYDRKEDYRIIYITKSLEDDYDWTHWEIYSKAFNSKYKTLFFNLIAICYRFINYLLTDDYTKYKA